MGWVWSNDEKTITTATTNITGCLLGPGHFTECFLKSSHFILVRAVMRWVNCVPILQIRKVNYWIQVTQL